MNPKKLTRGAFYVLFVVAGAFALYLLTDLTIRYWDVASHVLLAIAISGAVVGLINLAFWAFNDYEKPEPFTYHPMPPFYPTPDYYTSEEYGLLSDGRAAVPTYDNSKFIGRFPENPFLNERVGDYRWGKSDHGDWIWLYDPMIVED